MIIWNTQVLVETKLSIIQQKVADSNLLMSAYILCIVQREIYAFIKPNSAGDIFIQVQQQRILINLLFDL